MADTWLYAHQGKRSEPIDARRLVSLILAGKLPEQVMVWRAGMKQWAPASSIPDLAEQLPPPLPRAPTEEVAPVAARPAALGSQAAPKVATPPVPTSIDLSGRRLEVTEKELIFNGRSLILNDITGVRYGGYVASLNSLPHYRSYCYWFTDGKRELKIECNRGVVAKKTGSIESTFDAVAAVVWRPVITRVAARLLESLSTGGFTITSGGYEYHGVSLAGHGMKLLTPAFAVHFDSEGLHRLKPGKESLPWARLRSWHQASGTIGLYADQRRKRPFLEFDGWVNDGAWAWFVTRTTWNAVCLPPVLEVLRGQGVIP